MKKNYQTLKYIKWISFVIISLYATHPILNGFGCDFHSEAEDSKRSIYTTCKFGVINTMVLDKSTKEVFSYSGLYGKSGDTIFFYVHNKEKIKESKDGFVNFSAMLDNSRLYVAHVFLGKKHDMVITYYPYYNAHKTKYVGVMGFF